LKVLKLRLSTVKVYTTSTLLSYIAHKNKPEMETGKIKVVLKHM